MTLRHKYCEDRDCRSCLDDHLRLEDALKQMFPKNPLVLGDYRNFMDERLGRSSETETGWAVPEVFEERNIHAFVVSQTEVTP